MKTCNPSPAKTSAGVPPDSVVLLKLTLPSIVTKFAILIVKSDSETSNISPSSAPKRITIVLSVNSIVSSTAPSVLLIRSRIEAPASRPPAAISALPDITPAIPEPRITKPPSPFVNVAASPATSTATSTSDAAICTTVVASGRVPLSKKKLPLRVLPATVTSPPTTSTRTKGPAGRSSNCVCPLISKASVTGADIVLRLTVTEPPACNPIVILGTVKLNPSMLKLPTTPWLAIII